MTSENSTQHEQQWKIFTQSANHHYTGQHYEMALGEYQRALLIAELQLNEAIRSTNCPLKPVVPMFVISCHNLADCYQCLNEPAKHLAFLQQAHQEILALCQDQGCPLPLRQQCLCDLSKTLFPLVECLRQHQPDQIAGIVTQTQTVVTKLQTVIPM